jgi:peptidoglycan hydrolase-like protein with peptidoglycan-binding domain
MKNLFIITEDEKKRILGLHEDATKRQYLSEQYNPNTEVLVVGTGDQPSVVFNKQTKKAVRFGNPTSDTKVRLSNDKNRQEGETYAKDPSIISQYKFAVTNKKIPTDAQIATLTKTITNTGLTNPVQKRTFPTSIEQLTQKGYYLRKGDKGPLVKTIQTKLLDAGEDVSLTSVFDDMTKKAVMSFQTKNNLISPRTKQPDGIVGPNTWGILSKVVRQDSPVKDTEPLKLISPSNVPADYGKTNQGVSNPNQTSEEYVEGGKYKYVFIDKNKNSEVTIPNVFVDRGTIPQTRNEYPSSGVITVVRIKEGGVLYSLFPSYHGGNGYYLDLEPDKNTPNIFNNEHLYDSDLKVKLIPKSKPIRSTGRGSGLASMEFDQFNQP